ncbi:uncharacterized protein LOC142339504 [Convolutriloba macropyga]|uniref:uncharacterized protein LOC142339504 n=1 Tax=Convolutriloba macropyga TaxID=536237 RepID=UPI003F51C5EF
MQETEPEGFSSIDRTNNNINPGPSSLVGYEGESRQHEDLQLQEQDTSGDVESWKNQSSIQQPGSSNRRGGGAQNQEPGDTHELADLRKHVEFLTRQEQQRQKEQQLLQQKQQLIQQQQQLQQMIQLDPNLQQIFMQQAFVNQINQQASQLPFLHPSMMGLPLDAQNAPFMPNMLNNLQSCNAFMQQLQASSLQPAGQIFQQPTLFGRQGITTGPQLLSLLNSPANQHLLPDGINNIVAKDIAPQSQQPLRSKSTGLLNQQDINRLFARKQHQGLPTTLFGVPFQSYPNSSAAIQSQIPVGAVSSFNFPPGSIHATGMLEELQLDERTSFYRLKNVFDEIRTEFYSMAWDRDLLALPTNEFGNSKTWNFSLRLRKCVFLSCISFDQKNRSEFTITKINVDDAESNSENELDIPCEFNLHDKNWKSQSLRLRSFVVEIIYTPSVDLERAFKAEACIQFELSNGTVVEKYVQVLHKLPKFNLESYERESVETYKPLKLGLKERNLVSVDNGMDEWTNKIAENYRIHIPPEVPNVHRGTKDTYKRDLHNALYLEEWSRSACLNDLSFEANIDFLPSYSNGDHKIIECGDTSIYAVIRCPFRITEDSIKGEALTNLADYVILSRRCDWVKSQSFVNCLDGKICDRFYRSEIEEYSEYDLKRC